jgi:hypothetical protein
MLGGKTPHIQNVAVGGVANAINLESEAALNVDRLFQMKSLLEKIVSFVQNVYVPDVCAIAGFYPHQGAGVTNYLSVPDLPLDGKSTQFELPGGWTSFPRRLRRNSRTDAVRRALPVQPVPRPPARPPAVPRHRHRGVEQTPALEGGEQARRPRAGRDTLQFIEAFRPVLDKVSAFTNALKFTIASRKASLAADSVQIYDIAKGLARDPGSAAIDSVVPNMKRDLGKRGRAKTAAALRKAASAVTTAPPAGTVS